MKRKIKTGVAVLFLASLVAVVWLFFHFQKDNRLAAAYIEEKYGMEVKIISETLPNFVDGHSYEMAFKEQEDLIFTVTEHEENYATIYRDDYKPLLAAYEAQQKVEKWMPQFKELGFTAPSEGELIEQVVKNMITGEAVRWLGLGTENNYETVEPAEIEALTKLLELVREQNIDVHIINVSNGQKENGVALDLREMDEVQTIEEVAVYITGSHLRELGPAGERMQAKWQDAATQAETDRFRFYDEWNDQWISCHQVNETGDCINLLANVTFSPGELSQQNPYLEEDLNAIFGFFDNIRPKLIAVDLVMVDPEREGNPVRFFLRERENYDSTDELINDLVKE